MYVRKIFKLSIFNWRSS